MAEPTANVAPNPIRRGKRFWRQGEPFVWASGGALCAILLLTAVLLVVVMWNGLGVFWPKPVAEIELTDGSTFLAQQAASELDPATGTRRFQFKIANRELNEMRDYRWVNGSDIEATQHPPDVFVLERVGYGDFYGFVAKVVTPGTQMPSEDDPATRFYAALETVRAKQDELLAPLSDRLLGYSRDLQQLRNRVLRVEYLLKRATESEGQASSSTANLNAELVELRAKEDRAKHESDQLVAKKSSLEAELRKNVAVFRLPSGKTHEVPLLDIVRPYQPNNMGLAAKSRHYLGKLWELLTQEPRESNTEGGLFPAIFGTIMLVFLMSFFCFPLGVLAGIYLGEYAKEGALVRVVRIAVNNLAGIPSIVYGIFGLGFFVYGIGGLIDRWFYPHLASQEPVFGTGGILWASLTLGLLTVPVVIVSTEEALRTIPRSMREGSYALGATKFQTLARVLLPMASPGVMTGLILAMARAAGEVAPLMITGVVKLAPQLPVDGQLPFFHPDRKFMHLGFHIFDIAFQSPNVEASKPMVFVTTLLLVLIVLAMSSVAISLRNRMRRRFQSRAI